MIETRKKPGESSSALIHRFTKVVRQSGLMKEVKKRRFKTRRATKLKKKLSALYRAKKKKEFAKRTNA